MKQHLKSMHATRAAILALGLAGAATLFSPGAVARAETPQASAASASGDVAAAVAPAAQPRRILVMWLSVGKGHESAAKAVAARIRAKDPTAQVDLVDTEQFAKSKAYRRFENKIYWFLVKNYPNIFDKMFHKVMGIGNRLPRLEEAHFWVDDKQLHDYIKAGGYDTVISTYFGAARSTGNLREKGELQSVKLAWLHTDYFRGYFPRLSQRIDQTFLGHRSLEQIWKDWGVTPESVTTSGMAISEKFSAKVDREAALREAGLDPGVRTVTIMGGSEGVGDFPAYVRSLARNAKNDLQIVTICGSNRKHVKELEGMLASGELQKLTSHRISLKVHGLVPLEQVVKYVKSSDLFITKSGGLSPAEGFMAQVPMVITDVYGGHERENAELFEKLGLGLINRDPAEIGKQANQIFESPALQQRQLAAQRAFREDTQLDRIDRFVFDPAARPRVAARAATPEAARLNARPALDKLAADSPGEVELILTRRAEDDVGRDSELALRVRDKVYLFDSRLEPGMPARSVPLESYLYGTERPFPGAQEGSDYGVARLRDAVSMRFSNLRPEVVDRVVAAAEGSALGARDASDYIARTLKPAGIQPWPNWLVKLRQQMHAANRFSAYISAVEGEPNFKYETIHYDRVHQTGKDGLSWVREPSPMGHDLPAVPQRRLSTFNTSRDLVYENLQARYGAPAPVVESPLPPKSENACTRAFRLVSFHRLASLIRK